jgi:RHS repeat-associated protein
MNLRFPGQYFDSESNLSYNYFRTYDARIRGGYVQPDPIGLGGGWSKFGYVGANPLGAIDPMGLQVIPRGMYLPRGPAISGPPAMATNNGIATTQSIMQQFTNMPNPSPELPGEYVGLNYPWSMPNIPPLAKPFCRMTCPSDTPNICKPSEPNSMPVRSLSGEMCRQVCTMGPVVAGQ